MGFINLFAEKCTPNLAGTLHDEYRDGLLHVIAIARACDDRTHPHIWFRMEKLERHYIVFELHTPITRSHVAWLYQELIEQGKSTIDKKALVRYAYEQCDGRRRNYRATTQQKHELWSDIWAFRRALEIPYLALRHYQMTALSKDDHTLQILNNVVIIEYTPRADINPATNRPYPAQAVVDEEALA